MNTKNNRRPVSIAVALTAGASIITVIGSAGSADASEPRGSLVTSDSVNTNRSYGEPLAALGGQSLAEYVSDHWAQVIVAGV